MSRFAHTSSPHIKNHYKRFRAHVQKAIRDAYWKHISKLFTLQTENTDPNCPRKNEKVEKVWSFVKSIKRCVWDHVLRENGIFRTDTVDKAKLCNKQFQSSFTRETHSDIRSKDSSPFTVMGDITVDLIMETFAGETYLFKPILIQ